MKTHLHFMCADQYFGALILQSLSLKTGVQSSHLTMVLHLCRFLHCLKPQVLFIRRCFEDNSVTTKYRHRSTNAACFSRFFTCVGG